MTNSRKYCSLLWEQEVACSNHVAPIGFTSIHPFAGHAIVTLSGAGDVRHPALKSRRRGGRVYYYCRFRGRTHGLGYDLDEARRRFSAIIGGRSPDSGSPTYGELVLLFDAWSASFSRPSTRTDYMYWLRGLGEAIDPHTPIDAVTPGHVEQWIAARGLALTWSHLKVVRCVRRLLQWSREQGHLSDARLPIDAIKRPPTPLASDIVLSPTQYVWLLRHTRGNVRESIRFLWHTGCRPEELSRIRTAWVDVKERSIRFPLIDAKGRRPRVVIYPMMLSRLIGRRVHAGGLYLFRPQDADHWTRYSMKNVMLRLMRKRPDLFPDGLNARMFRYSFATRMIKSGVDLITLSHLMGHSDLSMLRRHYAKIGGDLDYLRNVLDRRTNRPQQH